VGLGAFAARGRLVRGRSPQVTGAVSDDGFVMSQFVSSSTLNLLGFGVVLDLFVGIVHLAAVGCGWGQRGCGTC